MELRLILSIEYSPNVYKKLKCNFGGHDQK